MLLYTNILTIMPHASVTWFFIKFLHYVIALISHSSKHLLQRGVCQGYIFDLCHQDIFAKD